MSCSYNKCDFCYWHNVQITNQLLCPSYEPRNMIKRAKCYDCLCYNDKDHWCMERKIPRVSIDKRCNDFIKLKSINLDKYWVL